MFIRKATENDACRIAEIIVFNNRLNFFPIFKCEEFSFKEINVLSVYEEYTKEEAINETYVYDDGIIRGFIRIKDGEIKKLYVDNFFQNKGYGAELLNYAVKEKGAKFLWALEKNGKAVRFYERHGFIITNEKKLEEGTTEYLIKLEREV